jgi:hypothetical protein
MRRERCLLANEGNWTYEFCQQPVMNRSCWVLLHAPKLGHGTDYLTSPPNAEDFYIRKIGRLRSGLNRPPQSLVKRWTLPRLLPSKTFPIHHSPSLSQQVCSRINIVKQTKGTKPFHQYPPQLTVESACLAVNTNAFHKYTNKSSSNFQNTQTF